MPKKSKESPISAEKAAESTPSTVTTTEETEVIPVVSIEVFSLDAGKFVIMAKSLNAKDVLLPATVEATEVMPAASISLEVYSLHEGKFITKTVALTPEQRAASKEFIAEFAKEYAREPECPANALINVMRNKKIEFDLEENQKNMSDEKIITDAHKVLHIGFELINDFNQNHDSANARLKEIITDHLPKLQQQIDGQKIKCITNNSETK